jgi:Flp pilus assembly pilin Flp
MDRINSLIVKLQTRREDGQAMVEYGLILGLVSVVAIVVLTAIGVDVNGVFQAVETSLDAVPGATP